jgi:hypothetical protein
MRVVPYLQRSSQKTSIDLDNLESLWGLLEMAEILGGLGPLSIQDIVEARTSLECLITSTLESSLKFPVLASTALPSAPRGYQQLAAMVKEAQDHHSSRKSGYYQFQLRCGH